MLIQRINSGAGSGGRISINIGISDYKGDIECYGGTSLLEGAAAGTIYELNHQVRIRTINIK